MKTVPRVLVVEDEPAIAELIAINLRHNGFQPIWAIDGEAAQRELEAVLPDVILLDWMLPGQSGLSLAKKWRAHARTKPIPILMITARGDEPDKIAGLDAGADDYITKPFSTQELLARIRAVLRRRSPEQAKEFCPPLNIEPGMRYPVLGAALQRRGGTARHDAVAWGYARAASALGVDIIQNCEVTGITRDPTGAVTGVDTTRGFIGANRVGVVAAGHTSVLMAMAGVRMPLESYPLQALVSEPIKPVMPCVVLSNTIHAYISQSDKGELVIGAGTDQYTSYSQTGGLHIINHTLDAICEMFPVFTRMKMLRSWGGIMDMSMDGSPIIATGRLSTQ